VAVARADDSGASREPARAPVTTAATSSRSIVASPGVGCAPYVDAAQSSAEAATVAPATSALVISIHQLPR
jgi:hypothetical protein